MYDGLKLLKIINIENCNEKMLIAALEMCCTLHQPCEYREQCLKLFDELCDSLPARGMRIV